MQKYYCGPGRAYIENPKSGMKHTAWLGPYLSAQDLITL